MGRKSIHKLHHRGLDRRTSSLRRRPVTAKTLGTAIGANTRSPSAKYNVCNRIPGKLYHGTPYGRFWTLSRQRLTCAYCSLPHPRVDAFAIRSSAALYPKILHTRVVYPPTPTRPGDFRAIIIFYVRTIMILLLLLLLY